MFHNAKNGVLKIEDTDMHYISFGNGPKNLIMIPGLGDGLKTTKGMAVPFSVMYKDFAISDLNWHYCMKIQFSYFVVKSISRTEESENLTLLTSYYLSQLHFRGCWK